MGSCFTKCLSCSGRVAAASVDNPIIISSGAHSMAHDENEAKRLETTTNATLWKMHSQHEKDSEYLKTPVDCACMYWSELGSAGNLAGAFEERGLVHTYLILKSGDETHKLERLRDGIKFEKLDSDKEIDSEKEVFKMKRPRLKMNREDMKNFVQIEMQTKYNLQSNNCQVTACRFAKQHMSDLVYPYWTWKDLKTHIRHLQDKKTTGMEKPSSSKPNQSAKSSSSKPDPSAKSPCSPESCKWCRECEDWCRCPRCNYNPDYDVYPYVRPSKTYRV